MVAVPPNLLAEPEENEGSPVCTSGDARLIGPDLLEERNRFSMLENRPDFVVNNWPVLDEPLQKRIASIVVNRRMGNQRLVREKAIQKTPNEPSPVPLNILAPRFSETL